jgi:predicted RNA-binding protein with TRAM domain
MSENETKPVSVGDEKEVTIEAVGRKGDGIAKVDNFVLFIPDAKEGQTVRVKVNKVLNNVGFAEIVGTAAPKQEAPPEEKPEDTEDF